MKIALGIEYNGAGFYGWQHQKGDIPTVQDSLTAALSHVANHPVAVVASGRTDRGVHATQQIVHFESDSVRSLDNWLLGANANLPSSIRVCWAEAVPDDFHARFCATARQYCYIIHPSHSPSALFHGLVTWDRRFFNISHMRDAAESLLGEHDFTSFRAAKCQANHPVRTIHHLDVNYYGPLIVIDIKANSFLHNMVRIIAGVLMRIGAGEQEVAWCEQVLQAKDRCLGDITAPPDGLYFIHAQYPDMFKLDNPVVYPLLLESSVC